MSNIRGPSEDTLHTSAEVLGVSGLDALDQRYALGRSSAAATVEAAVTLEAVAEMA